MRRGVSHAGEQGRVGEIPPRSEGRDGAHLLRPLAGTSGCIGDSRDEARR
jgi:hypothetical protein